MKKIFNIIVTVALAATVMHTFDMLAGANKPYQGRRGSSRSAALQRRGRRVAQARQIRRQRQKALAQNPVARKKEAQINQKITQNTQALEKSVEQEKKAVTPAQKEKVKKTTSQLANDLLATLKEERTFTNDVYHGYEEEQIRNARLTLTKLYPIQEKVRNALTQKERDLAQVTDAGYIWNAAQKGKEKEYNDLSTEVTKLKNTLKRIETAIDDRKVIAGDKWANAYKALLGAGAIGALGTAAAIGNLVMYGSSGAVAKTAASVGSGLSSMPGWLKEKTGGTWEWSKWVASYGFAAASSLLSAYKAYTFANNIYQTALAGYNTAFGEQQKKNPNASPEQITASLAKQKADLDAKQKQLEQKENAFKAMLAQAEAQRGKK